MMHGLHHGDISNCSHWGDIETRCLINIWREPDIFAEVRDICSKNKTVYKRIARRINAAGHHRDESQIRNKIRMLTNNYRRLLKVKDRFNWTGKGKHTFLYFDELHEFVDRVSDAGEAAEATPRPSVQELEEGVSPSSPASISSHSPAALQQLGIGTFKLENSPHHRVDTTTAYDRDRGSLSNDFGDHDVTATDSGISDGTLLLNTNGRAAGPRHNFSSEDDFDDEGTSQEAEMQVHPVIEAGWISDEDEVECVEPRAKIKYKADFRLHPNNAKKGRTRNPKKDETIKHIVQTLTENNIHRDKIFMEAEDAHRRMEAERHTEEIRLLRDQIQLERDRLQFEREERERMELMRREEAARNERLRREEMERTEKARLDERDREERRFALMMALIKGAQNHSK